MKSIVTDIRLQFNESHQPELVLALSLSPQQAQEGISKLKEVLAKGKKLEATIDKQKRKRSLDMNSYAWVLCQKLAEVIGSTKELVYQGFIKDVGQFEIVPIRDDAVERWIRNWNAKGLGWHSEIMSDSKLEGYKNVISYYGSSVYSVSEMSVLLNEIVGECLNLGIDTMSPKELKSLEESWGGKS